jgi:endonuclease YncB( thermonuclease family)
VSRHWNPQGDIVRIGAARQPGRGIVVAVIAGAVVVGLGAGALLGWSGQPAAVAPSPKIEWNAVQKVPRRTLSADEVAWERRGQEQDSPSTTPDQVRGSGASGAFGYCQWGGGTNCVVDGDTFWIGGEKVRIAGIDAPETHPSRCEYEAKLGNAATEKLRALLNGGAVTMTAIDRDRDVYGRLLRNVAVNGQDVGEAMVSAGVAREYGSGRQPWC